MNGRYDISIGKYRSHEESMQIVSGPVYAPKIHFEAPPSLDVPKEMNEFIKWFNDSSPTGANPLPPLLRTAISHNYFLSIHPFEDGNGRIGRALIQRSFAQYLDAPALLAVSNVIQENKKDYYNALKAQNTHNHIDNWLTYFADMILEAQKYTIKEIEFIVMKGHFLVKHAENLNTAQHKVIIRLFDAGTKGFIGGLSRDNYVSISKVSPRTATRQLQDLVEKQILRMQGKGRSVRYYLNI